MNFRFCIVILIVLLSGCQQQRIAQEVSDAYPDIFPDYVDVTVPYSVAPLNFTIAGAKAIRADVKDAKGEVISFFGNRMIDFSKKWTTLLEENKGKDIQVTVSVWTKEHTDGIKYQSFPIHIAADDIDPYIAYRLIEPGYESWHRIELCERQLSSFRERAFVSNEGAKKACLNCHSFYNYSPDTFLFHVRGKNGGTVFYKDGKVRKIDLAELSLKKQGVYPMWHPDGRFIAFASNKTLQVFYHQGEKPIEVFDQASDIILFDTQKNETSTAVSVCSDSIFETFPAWAPDGNSLYFSAAKIEDVPDSIEKVHYSILKVAFDKTNGTFSDKVDTVYAATDTTSASWPRISPDGRYLLYTLARYGTFPIWHKEADFKMLNLIDGEEVDTDIINSDDTDSYHSWSSNGRWVLFTSRRIDGRYTRLFIAHFDKNGKFHKPFLLPQKDPEENVTRLRSYNVPEFVSGEVHTSKNTFKEIFKMMKK